MPLAVTLLLCAALLLAACSPVRPSSGGGIAWQAPIEVASGGGTKGPWRQNDSVYDYVDDATVAFTRDGMLAVAWVDQRAKDVRFQLRGPDGAVRGAPLDVSRSPATFSWHPRLATGGDGAIHLLWQEIIFSGGSHGGDILFSHSRDGGRSFSRPLNLSNSLGGDGKGRLDRDTWSNGSLDIAVGPAGSVVAAWTEYDGALWLARSRDGGASFSRPLRVAGDDTLPARGPSLAQAPDGDLYLAWTVGEDNDADIRVARSSDGGLRFAPPVTVGAPGARADAPRLAFDGSGSLHLVYAEYPQSRGAPAIRHARADRGTLRFGTPRTLSQAGQPGSYPQLAADGLGLLHAAWEADGDGPHPHGLMHAVVSADACARPALVPGSVDPRGGRNGSQQGLLGKKLAAGPEGRVVLANSSLVPGKASRVWLLPGRRGEDGQAGR